MEEDDGGGGRRGGGLWMSQRWRKGAETESGGSERRGEGHTHTAYLWLKHESATRASQHMTREGTVFRVCAHVGDGHAVAHLDGRAHFFVGLAVRVKRGKHGSSALIKARVLVCEYTERHERQIMFPR
jgi:hypothetical protein